MDRSAEVFAFLDGLRVPYRVYEHPPVASIEACQHIPGVDYGAAAMPKNIFLCNRQQTAFYLLLIRHSLSFRTAVVSKLLGVSRLSFAPEALLPEMLGLRPGAVSPLGLIFDADRRVRLVVDDQLLCCQRLLFHPCVNDRSVEMSAQDFVKVFLPAAGHDARLITIKEQ